jgi:hypothetical protein
MTVSLEIFGGQKRCIKRKKAFLEMALLDAQELKGISSSADDASTELA